MPSSDDPFLNPSLSSLVEVEELITAQGNGRIRFDHACYDTRLLGALNQLCAKYGSNLTISFYGHYGEGFDGASLAELTNLRSLNLAVTRIKGIENLARLSLTGLCLESFELKNPGILSEIDLSSMEELGVGNTRASNVDLSPLARARELRWLGLSGHKRGLDNAAGLPKLDHLYLRRIGKTQSLEVIQTLPALETLEIGLGGRESIKEVSNSTLQILSIGGVLGLNDLHDLSRFPRLSELNVACQPRLTGISFESASRALRNIGIWDCKTLSRVTGLEHLPELEELAIQLTAVDLNEFLNHQLPTGLKFVRLNSGKRPLDRSLRERLDALGYGEFPPVIQVQPPRGVRGPIG